MTQQLLKSAFVIFLGFLTCASLAEAKSDHDDFDYDQLSRLMMRLRPRSVEELLEWLPYNLRKNRILLHHSQSQDVATKNSPRIILHNDNATLLMAVSGNVQNKRGNLLEIAYFDNDQKRYVPVEIVFGDFAGKPYKLSHSPQSCAGCHSSDFRPLWRTYDVWPGAFGFAHAEGIPSRLTEVFQYKKFRDQSDNFENRRNRLLNTIPARVSDLARGNTTFSVAVALTNAQRVARIIFEDLKGNPKKFIPTIGALAGITHTDFLMLLRQVDSTKLTDSQLKEWSKIAETTIRSNADKKIKLARKLNSLNGPVPFENTRFEEDYVDVYTQLLILENHVWSTSLSSWSTNLQGSFEVTLPAGNFLREVAIQLILQCRLQDIDLSHLAETLKAQDLLRQIFHSADLAMQYSSPLALNLKKRYEYDRKFEYQSRNSTNLCKLPFL